MYCGLCVEACPFDALAMSDQFELASYDMPSLVYTKEQLAEIGRRSHYPGGQHPGDAKLRHQDRRG